MLRHSACSFPPSWNYGGTGMTGKALFFCPAVVVTAFRQVTSFSFVFFFFFFLFAYLSRVSLSLFQLMAGSHSRHSKKEKWLNDYFRLPFCIDFVAIRSGIHFCFSSPERLEGEKKMEGESLFSSWALLNFFGSIPYSGMEIKFLISFTQKK